MQVCNYVMYACVHKPMYLFVSCLLRHTTFILHIAVFHHEEKRDSNLCVCVCVRGGWQRESQTCPAWHRVGSRPEGD